MEKHVPNHQPCLFIVSSALSVASLPQASRRDINTSASFATPGVGLWRAPPCLPVIGAAGPLI